MLHEEWLPALLIVIGIAALVVALRYFRNARLRNRACSRCEASAVHGYSRMAESDLKNIDPLCLSCLLAQLEQDYTEYQGRTILIQPVADVPCYVFRDRKHLKSLSQDLDREAQDLLVKIRECQDCGEPAHFLWIESHGFKGERLGNVLEKGLTKTLLNWANAPSEPLCGKCSVKRISGSLRGEGFAYTEVCSPHGTEVGIVLPTGY